MLLLNRTELIPSKTALKPAQHAGWQQIPIFAIFVFHYSVFSKSVSKLVKKLSEKTGIEVSVDELPETEFDMYFDEIDEYNEDEEE